MSKVVSLIYEVARSISTPPGWNASPLQGYPLEFSKSPVSIYTVGCGEPL